MAEGVLLEPGTEVAGVEDQVEPPQVPSIFSITNVHMVGNVDVSLPAEDGSRLLRFHSQNRGTIIELNIAQELCEFVAEKLVAAEIIEQEETEDAGQTPEA